MNEYFGEGRISGEKNDCTVISLSHALGISYQDAHAICKRYGRKNKKGFSLRRVFRFHNNKRDVLRKFINHKYRIINLGRPYMTIKTFKKWRTTGTFICSSSTHSFCIKDGIIYNQINENQKIRYYYEVIKK